MSIHVEATGRVADAPSAVSTDHGMLAVFVFDPYPEPAPESMREGAAHGCEVRCRDERLIGEVLGHGEVGAPVAVTGELILFVVSGPMEDELCAVRAAIEAEDVCFGSVTEPSP
ncbi:MAG TPA: hypothetical protein VGK78_17065 [Nocardioides sp.]|uniref:hypothetical protein n=1 Tax=Nocardioides sp. TaxID=35761 RepID=UPI002F4163C8